MGDDRERDAVLRPSAACVPAVEDDHAALVAMMREYYPHEGIVFDEAKQGPALRRLLRDPALGKAFLVRVGDETAGYVILTFDFGLEAGGREAFIDELYLREPFRDRGIGAQVLRFVEAACRDWGVVALQLVVDLGNARARALYRAFGFEESRRIMMTRPLRP